MPCFGALVFRRSEPGCCVFDLLWLNGHNYRSKPLLRRKAHRAVWVAGLLYASPVLRRGADLFRAACERDIAGVLAKHAGAPYGAQAAPRRRPGTSLWPLHHGDDDVADRRRAE